MADLDAALAIAVGGFGLRVHPRVKAMQVVDGNGRCFRAAKRQVAERIVDAASSPHSRAYWRAVFVFVKQLEAGRPVNGRLDMSTALKIGMGANPSKLPADGDL